MELTDTTAAMATLRAALADGVEDWKPRVQAMAQEIHAPKEISFEEVRSAEATAALLADGGFEVERGTGGLPTAFTASAGSGELTVALCVEYDALPDIGHACGHNLIAGASVAAALALRPYVDELGITLKAIGTPAEEHGGGKALMLERGAFDGVGLALMVHPVQDGLTYNPAGTSAQAVGRYKATFTGKAAHAAAAPHQAVNAADAAVLSQVAVGLLRQQIPSDHRIALLRRRGRARHQHHSGTGRGAVRVPGLHPCRNMRPCWNASAAASRGPPWPPEPRWPSRQRNPSTNRCSRTTRWPRTGPRPWRRSARTPRPRPASAAAPRTWATSPRSSRPCIPGSAFPGADVPIHSHAFAALADSPEAYGVMFEAATALAWTVAAAASTPTERARFTKAAYRRRTFTQEGTS